MAAGSMDAVVRFIGDTSKLQSDLRDVETAGNKLGTSFKSVGKRIAGAVAGAFATSRIIDFTKASVDAAEESERVTNRLERAYKGMGDTTGALAKHAENYAQTLMKQTAIDDETIMGAEAKLVLFKSLSTEVAQSSGVFDRATAAAADLSARGLGDMGASAVKVGKILEDPIKNINALSRAGVQFTDEQKAHIETLVASGDMLGAQRFVLGEIEKRVGGAAAASATSADKAKLAFQEMQEKIGTALLPVIDKVAPVIADLATAFGNLPAPVATATLALAGFGAVALTIGGTVGLVVAAVAAIGVAAFLVWTQWDQIWNWIKDHPAYAIIISILAAPIAWFVLIIGALKTLWQNWDAIWGAISQATDDAKTWIVNAFNAVVQFFAELPGKIGAALASVFDTLTQPFQDAWNFISGIFDDISGGIALVKSGANAIIRTYNAVARKWNGFEIPSVDLGPFGEIGGGGLPHLPIIEELAKGGIVRSATLALVGERGPEAVIPLNKATTMGGQFTFNITVEVAQGVNPAAVGAATVDAIRQYERVAGKAWRA